MMSKVIKVLAGALLVIAIAIIVVGRLGPGGVDPATLPPLPEVSTGNVDPAVRAQIATTRRQVDANPIDPLANGTLGVLYEIYQYPAAARVCYQRASIIAPGEFRWHYYLARIERALGAPDRVVAVLESALQVDPDYEPAVTLLGEVLLEQGQIEPARATFERALQINPGSCKARLGLGKVLAAEERHEEAIDHLQFAAQSAPDYRPVHYALGLSFRALDRMEDAERHFDLASQGGAASPDPDPLVAAMYQLEIGVDSDYRRAKSLLNGGRFDESIVLLQSVVAKEPDHFGAHGALGQALQRTNRNDEALVHFERAIELNPTNIDFLRPVSLLLFRAKRYAEAEVHLRQAIELGGDHADDYHVLGAILSNQRRNDEALDAFALALERNPEHVEARRNFARLLQTKVVNAPDDAAAIPYLRRLTELAPRDVTNWTMLGGLLTKEGDLEGAIAAFDRALLVKPGLPEVERRRAELVQQLDEQRRGGG